MSTAFVLSGGASLGAIQVGMLRALFERGIAPDLVVGTSVGAVNGAFIASRPPTVETADALGQVWLGLRRGRVFPMDPLSGLAGLLGQRNNLVPSRSLRRVVSEHVEFDRLEEARISLHVIAVDLFSGAERRLSHGPAVDAILASAAIPGVFPPVEWEDTELVDGGIANNTPISQAIALGAEEIYVLPTGHACALDAPPRGPLAMGLHATTLMIQHRLTEEVERLKGEARLVVLPPPCPLTVQPIDFSRAAELIGRAAEDGRRYLERHHPGDPPLSMRPHRHRHHRRDGARQGVGAPGT